MTPTQRLIAEYVALRDACRRLEWWEIDRLHALERLLGALVLDAPTPTRKEATR